MGSESMTFWVCSMEELIPAGTNPHQWEGPMESLHRQISFSLVFTAILFIILTLILNINSMIILGIVYFFIATQLTVWSSFKKKSKNAIMPAMLNLLICSVLFGSMSVFCLALGLSFGDFSYLLSGVLFLLATSSSWKRLRILRDPIFKGWYQGLKINFEAMRLNRETVVSCHNCESILAIDVTKFGIDLKCPTCNDYLVSELTINSFTEEE